MMTTFSPSRAIAVVEVAAGDELHAERARRIPATRSGTARADPLPRSPSGSPPP